MATINLTRNDPQNRLAALPLLVPTLQAAVDYIDRYVLFRGTLDIEINVEATATGRFAATGDVVFAGTFNRVDKWEASLVAESRTGVDPNPGKADISIYIDPTSSYLAHLWWDPAIATSLDANPPDNRTDAFSVLVHELLHGMGIVGWRDIETGALPGNYQSVWDSLVTVVGGVAGGRATFGGPATLALLGQPPEVRLGGSQGAFHLGNAPTGPDALSGSAQPWIERANFNSYYYYDGERYTLGRLELALLQDIGWTLEPGITLTDVVNRWDDQPTPLYQVGWDTGETLLGAAQADRLEGRGGNDTLSGGGGDDLLDGGNGIDTATYALSRSSYNTSRSGNTLVVQAGSGSEGRDELLQIERVQFADRHTAFDLDGRAGLTARLIGSVFGPAEVRNPAYVGIGLKLLDSGTSDLALAQLAIEARLGAAPSAADVVNLLYFNVVGVLPTADVQRSFTDLLANGSHSRASLTLMAAQTDIEAQRIDLVGLSASGLDYLPG